MIVFHEFNLRWIDKGVPQPKILLNLANVLWIQPSGETSCIIYFAGSHNDVFVDHTYEEVKSLLSNREWLFGDRR